MTGRFEGEENNNEELIRDFAPVSPPSLSGRQADTSGEGRCLIRWKVERKHLERQQASFVRRSSQGKKAA